MYPSGLWRGYWEQDGFGRQVMAPLLLRFHEGLVEGSGEDCVGAFEISGRYDERGAVVIVKQYLYRHQVLYRGEHDGEGTIFGRWNIGEHYSGAFALTPASRRLLSDAPIQEI